MSTNQRPHRSVITTVALALLVGAALATTGCPPKVNSGVGFQLPKGDVERGRQAFIELKCYTCHKVDGVELPAPIVPDVTVVVLGGEVTQTRTYGRLMTAIIHPTESISVQSFRSPGNPPLKSPMPALNETMTVAQLVNLITFLQPHYRELQPTYQPVLMP